MCRQNVWKLKANGLSLLLTSWIIPLPEPAELTDLLSERSENRVGHQPRVLQLEMYITGDVVARVFARQYDGCES